MIRILMSAGVILSACCFLAAPASAKKDDEELDIPKCTHSLGTAAIREPENQWWRQYNLGNPEALIKLIVLRSGCFQLVDRAGGLEMMQAERGLSGDGELQRGSNLGKGQMVAADYFVVPDIVGSDENASGNSVGGAVGGLLGGRKLGGLLGGMKSKKLTAHTLLTLTNTRTGVQELIAEGKAKKKDVSFGGGGGFFGAGLGLAAGGGGYADTEIGQVISVAYINAYRDMVTQMGGLSGNAKAEAPLPAHEMVESARMYVQPNEDGGVVRMLRQGTIVYPTGGKSDIYWEVEDDTGNKGWVSSEYLDQAR